MSAPASFARSGLALAAALAAGPLLAQDAAAPEAPAGPPPVRIISLGGLTGAAAGAAADIISARELAALHVNRGGGLEGGRKIALDLVDVGCDGPAAARAGEIAAEAFRTARAAAFLGPVCSDATLSAAQAAIALGAPLISDGATTPELTGLADDDLVFRTAPSDLAAAQGMATLALSRGHARIAIAHGQDAWSTALADAFAAAYTEAGGVIAARQTFAPGQDSYRPEMESLAGAAEGARALALFTYAGGDGAAALDAALRQGEWQAVFGGDGLLDKAVMRRVGMMKMARVTLVAPSPDRSREAWKRYAAAARAAGLDPEAPLAAQGYDAAMVLALALVRSGGRTGTELAAAIREVTDPGAPPVLPDDWRRARGLAAQGPVNYVGASGEVDFDAAGDAALPVAVWRASMGGWKASPLR